MKTLSGITALGLIALTIGLTGCGGGGGGNTSPTGPTGTAPQSQFAGSYAGTFTSNTKGGSELFKVQNDGTIRNGSLSFTGSSIAYNLDGDITDAGALSANYTVNGITYQITGNVNLSGTTLSGPITVTSPQGIVAAQLEAAKS